MSDGDLTDILKDRDQILMAAWMLPNAGELSEGQRKQAMENFRAYMRGEGLTPEDVGRRLGKPRTTTIIELLQGKWRANADAHIRKLNMWVEQHARAKAASLADPFVSTKVAKAMLTIARLVREHKTMGLALGPTGIGKSRCAQAIHETYVGSIYVRVITGYHHAKGLTHAIADPLGVRKSSSTRDRDYQFQLERVIAALVNTERLIILDEAQKLSDGALELLRDIHDTTGVPILLIATKDLHDRILRSVDADHGQAYSRYDIIQHLTQGKDAYSGGSQLFTVADIKALYEQTPIRLSPDAARFLQGLANQLGYGSLRRCKILLRSAVRRARKRQDLGEAETVTVLADDLEWVETRLRQEASEQDVVRERRKRAAGATDA
jgi:DNA transposition AAA+ family ATPase